MRLAQCPNVSCSLLPDRLHMTAVCLVAVFILTRTWVKCTSLDSSRCAVYFGTKTNAISAASKHLKRDEC